MRSKNWSNDFQGLGRVGSPGQGMGKLLDQDGGEAQLLLSGMVEDLLPVAIADVEAIVQFGSIVLELGLRM